MSTSSENINAQQKEISGEDAKTSTAKKSIKEKIRNEKATRKHGKIVEQLRVKILPLNRSSIVTLIRSLEEKRSKFFDTELSLAMPRLDWEKISPTLHNQDRF